jgi:hypothetical protein
VPDYNSEDYAFLLAAVRDAVGEDFDDLDEPQPEPARHITTLAGNRVPVIDPYGRSYDAP